MATSPNPFDQFDAAPQQAPAATGSNPFDQFDVPAPAANPHRPFNFREGLRVGLDRLEESFPLASALADTGAHIASQYVASPIAGIAGVDSLPWGADTAARNVERVSSALTYEPQTAGGQALTKVGGVLSNRLAAGANRVGEVVAEGTGSPALGTAANVSIQALPALLLKGRGKAGELLSNDRSTPVLGGRANLRAASENPESPPQSGRSPGLGRVSEQAPTKEALKSESAAAYKRAEESGVVIKPESFAVFKQKVSQSLAKDGVDPTLHPSTTAALKRISETKGPVTLSNLETLRRIAKDAEGSTSPADRRLAARTVDMLDGYAETLSEKDIGAGNIKAIPALREARGLWSRARKADTLDELMRRAELSAPNFSGSGMENALRTEFRNLAKNERRMRMFTSEERAAIERVAKGGPLENTLRMLGKAAPTGSVSTAAGMAVGFMAGGPVGAAMLPAAGAVSRLAAKRMTLSNVERANELVRRGPVSTNALLRQELETTQ